MPRNVKHLTLLMLIFALTLKLGACQSESPVALNVDVVDVVNNDSKNYSIVWYAEKDEAKRNDIDNVLRKTIVSNFSVAHKTFKFPVYSSKMFVYKDHVYTLSKNKASISCKYTVIVDPEQSTTVTVTATRIPDDASSSAAASTTTASGDDCYSTHFDQETRDLSDYECC